MTSSADLISTSKDLSAFAVSDTQPLAGLARKLSGYFMFLAHAGEPEERAALEAEIATDYAKFNAEVERLKAGAGQ